MDLSIALQKHAEWKLKFRAAMTRGETMDAAVIARDNCCELGRWLHGEGKAKLGRLPTLRECLAKHAEFHREAGKIAQAINAKQFVDAEVMLKNGSPYSIASADVGLAILQLRKAIPA